VDGNELGPDTLVAVGVALVVVRGDGGTGRAAGGTDDDRSGEVGVAFGVVGTPVNGGVGGRTGAGLLLLVVLVLGVVLLLVLVLVVVLLLLLVLAAGAAAVAAVGVAGVGAPDALFTVTVSCRSRSPL
jgi:O-antigen ligase